MSLTLHETLAVDVLEARSGDSTWVTATWLNGPPAWAMDLSTIGALARLPEPHGQLRVDTLQRRAQQLLEQQGDRGWSALMEVLIDPHHYPSGSYWLRKQRGTWPKRLLRWPEERIRAMAFTLRLRQVRSVSNAVAQFEYIESHDELTLARWLTGRTWAKGSSVVEVMKDARLSMEHTLWCTTDLWHTLVKDKKAWLTQDDIAEIDCDCARDPWAWPAALERKRCRRT